jgi:hypothetical protein
MVVGKVLLNKPIRKISADEDEGEERKEDSGDAHGKDVHEVVIMNTMLMKFT